MGDLRVILVYLRPPLADDPAEVKRIEEEIYSLCFVHTVPRDPPNGSGASYAFAPLRADRADPLVCLLNRIHEHVRAEAVPSS